MAEAVGKGACSGAGQNSSPQLLKLIIIPFAFTAVDSKAK